MSYRYSQTVRLLSLCSAVLAFFFVSSARAAAPWDWWPDPATERGLAVWVSYSNEYESYQDPLFVEDQLNGLDRERIEVVFMAISSSMSRPHLQRLSDRKDRFAIDVQDFLNRLDARGIPACAALFSDSFAGSNDQMARVTLVDHLIEFNRTRGDSDAGFRCLSTDLEMPEGSRSSAVYGKWKEFHNNLKTRITPADPNLKLFAWMQGPDFLIDRMDDADDQEALMSAEQITRNPDDPNLFQGALRYFLTQGNIPIVDVAIGMWYFCPVGPYQRRLAHNVNELRDVALTDVYLLAGILVRNEREGLCCAACVRGRRDYEARLKYNDSVRMQFPGFIGTAIFKWPVPSNWSCGVCPP